MIGINSQALITKAKSIILTQQQEAIDLEMILLRLEQEQLVIEKELRLERASLQAELEAKAEEERLAREQEEQRKRWHQEDLRRQSERYHQQSDCIIL